MPKTFPALILEDFNSTNDCMQANTFPPDNLLPFTPISHRSIFSWKQGGKKKERDMRVTTWKEFGANRTYACSLLLTSVGQNDCLCVTDAM